MSYDDTNRGALWGNRDKASDKHPDLKGEINIDGKVYWLSGWKRAEDANPKAPALKLSVTPKESRGPTRGNPTEQGTDHVRTETGAAAAGGGFDDIPFAPVDWRT